MLRLKVSQVLITFQVEELQSEIDRKVRMTSCADIKQYILHIHLDDESLRMLNATLSPEGVDISDLVGSAVSVSMHHDSHDNCNFSLRMNRATSFTHNFSQSLPLPLIDGLQEVDTQSFSRVSSFFLEVSHLR